jgi:hypothetical protein
VYIIIIIYIGIGTMGTPGAGAPLCLFDSCIPRLNFTHTDHTALAYRSIEPPSIRPSSYTSDIIAAKDLL